MVSNPGTTTDWNRKYARSSWIENTRTSRIFSSSKRCSSRAASRPSITSATTRGRLGRSSNSCSSFSSAVVVRLSALSRLDATKMTESRSPTCPKSWGRSTRCRLAIQSATARYITEAGPPPSALTWNSIRSAPVGVKMPCRPCIRLRCTRALCISRASRAFAFASSSSTTTSSSPPGSLRNSSSSM